MALNNQKFTPELVAEACKLAREGNYRTTIGKKLGVHPDTFFRWLKQGHDDFEAEVESEYASFYAQFDQAEAEWEVEKVGEINTAASQDARHWTASMTMLERKFPDRWGKREHVTLEGQRPIQQLNQVVLIDSDAAGAARDFLRRIGSVSPHLAIGPGLGSESEGERERVVEQLASRPTR